jgi:hypothetical protein
MNSIPLPRMGLIVLGVIGVFVLAAAFGYILPPGVDWSLTFRPATLIAASGGNPYQSNLTAPFAGTPWALIPLIPLALLPEPAGRGILFIIGLASFAYAAHQLKAGRWALIFFLLSPVVMHGLLNANLDWMPVLGYVLPPAIGLFFITVKPQMGSVVAIFWLVEAWHQGGWRQTLKTFAPISIAYLLSFTIYGLWPLNMLKASSYTTWWNASLWPMSIPIGLALGVAALRHRNIRYAMAASPALSPHVIFHSWSAALIAIVSSTPETIAAVIGLWILVFLRW